eukprot:TRINITY_DN36989_c0_g1_i1.p1 TRINITY_DN36989_c0_g1~~TRINITY_DN36989_c0_g1_i1.p1  ORF type:complete len:521 (+),score=69.61 TRINITY_DN36989_c0_g1_i1:82-1563(+)
MASGRYELTADSEDGGLRPRRSSRSIRIQAPKLSEEDLQLPDLMDRIGAMGIADEYLEFKERYMSWRKGHAKGARGDVGTLSRSEEHTMRSTPAIGSFGYWYPTVHEWRWSRTISYWIAITFFVGSIFFTISSFSFNYPELLGRYKFPITTGGYIAGKVMFLICTYLMCFETINLTAIGHNDKGSSCSDSSSDSEAGPSMTYMPTAMKYKWWPFRWKKAIRNLEELGAGPYPYYASVIYFMGVLVFGVGLAAEFSPLPEEAIGVVLRWSFLIGSIMFTVGGLMECIENEVFTSLSFSKGYVGAVLNTLGGVGFVVGAVLAWWDAYWSNFAYGVGSAIFLFGSSTMIIMWKDEQYGLTFLAVLNELGTPQGLNRIATGDVREWSPENLNVTFSMAGAIFIHVYCFAVSFSVYNMMMELMNVAERPTLRNIQFAFNELVPAIVCIMVLALASAVVRSPRIAPYRQLFIGIRVLSVILVLNSLSTTLEFVFINLKK